MKKKFTFAVICLLLAVITAFSLTACTTPANRRGDLSAKDAYGLGAVSTVRLLGGKTSAAALKTFAKANAKVQPLRAQDTASEMDEIKAQAEKFNEYFRALDSFLGEELISTATVANTDADYPYETKMTVTGRDFDGETVPYVMYYTETEYTDHDLDDDDDEIEKTFRLEGVMVIDGTDYVLEGQRCEETETDESETELKIRAYANASDKTNYVQMEQEHSVESDERETEYVYSVYANEQLVEQTAVEFEEENENGTVETEYELEFRNGTGKGRYSVEREVKNNVAEITVKYNINGNRGKFVIREITGTNGEKQYEYTFDDGSKCVF